MNRRSRGRLDERGRSFLLSFLTSQGPSPQVRIGTQMQGVRPLKSARCYAGLFCSDWVNQSLFTIQEDL
jgi:hypothetical protein